MANYEAFDNLAQATLAKPRLNAQELLEVFLAVEDLIFYAVDLLLQTTTFVEDSLCYVLSEIATGVIKARKIYRGKRSKRRVSVGGALDLGAENYRALSHGFDLFKLSRLDRITALPLTRRVLRQMHLSTNIYEQILRSFVKETSAYVEKTHILVDVETQLRRILKSDPDCLVLEARKKICKEELRATEAAVGCMKPARLYGMVKETTRVLHSITQQQERVLSSYQRMVLQQSRGKSFSENEALDLFQAGSLGLSKAVSLWDLDGESSFPVFASFWIRQRILGSAKISGPLVKLPWSIWEAYTAIRAAERELESESSTRHSYTDADIAERIGRSVASIGKIRETVAGVKYISLESPQRLDDSGDVVSSTVGATLVDSSVEEVRAEQEAKEAVNSLLLHLTPKERRLVCLRYGLVDALHYDGGSDRLGVVKELLRQAACRAWLYQYLTNSTETSASPRC